MSSDQKPERPYVEPSELRIGYDRKTNGFWVDVIRTTLIGIPLEPPDVAQLRKELRNALREYLLGTEGNENQS